MRAPGAGPRVARAGAHRLLDLRREVLLALPEDIVAASPEYGPGITAEAAGATILDLDPARGRHDDRGLVPQRHRRQVTATGCR